MSFMNPKPSLLPKVRFLCIFLQSYGDSIFSSLANTRIQALNAETTRNSRKHFLLHVSLGLHPGLCNPNTPANFTLYLHRVSHDSYFLTRTICVASLSIHTLPRFSSILSIVTECFRISPQKEWHGISIFLTKKEEKKSVFTPFPIKKAMLCFRENNEDKKQGLFLTLAPQDEFPLLLC